MKNYINALLSEVAYQNITNINDINSSIDSYEKQFLTSHFEIINPVINDKPPSVIEFEIPSPNQGFNALTFKVTQDIIVNGTTIYKSGEYIVAYRGTEADSFEIVNDLLFSDLKLSGLTEYLRFFFKPGKSVVKTATDIISSVIKSSLSEHPELYDSSDTNKLAADYLRVIRNKVGDDAQISLTGHSLGGFLAAITSMETDINVKETNTFNSAGISWYKLFIDKLGTWINEQISSPPEDFETEAEKIEYLQTLNEIKNTMPLYNVDNINAIYSSTGPEMVSNDTLLYHPENRYGVVTLDASYLDLHGIGGLKKTLKLYSILDYMMGENNNNYEKIGKLLDLNKFLYSKNGNEQLITQQQLSHFINIDNGNLLTPQNFFDLFGLINNQNFQLDGLTIKLYNELNSPNTNKESFYSILNLIPFTVYGSQLLNNNDEKNDINSYSSKFINERISFYNKIYETNNIVKVVYGIESQHLVSAIQYKLIIADAGSSTNKQLTIDASNKIIYANDLSLLDFESSNMQAIDDILDGLLDVKTNYFMGSATYINIKTKTINIFDTFNSDEIVIYGSDTGIYLTKGNDKITVYHAFGARLTEIQIEDGGVGDTITFLGGLADETIIGTKYNDVLKGNEGDDILISGLGNDSIEGGKGNDIINNTASLLSYNTNGIGDTINGGEGKNTLYGTGNGDIYIYGGGEDTIIEKDFSIGSGFIDVLKLGYAATNGISFWRNTFELVIQLNGFNKIFVVDYFYHYEYLEEIHYYDNFNNNVILTTNDILSRISYEDPNTMYGSAGDDVITGNANNNNIYGGTGDDTIKAGSGNDFIFGGDGNDKLYGDAGNDTIYGDDGDDYIDGGTGNDILYGGNGNDTIIGGISGTVAEVDTIYGGSGNDIINIGQVNTGDIVWGGTGDDIIYGAAGSDTYHYDFADGNDTIIESNTAVSYIDRLYLHNISPDILKIYRLTSNVNDLIIEIENSGKIIFKNYYSNSGTLNYLDEIIFDNGTKYTSNIIKQMASNLYGTDNADSITLNNTLSTILFSKDGNDSIRVERDNNEISAGKGNDNIVLVNSSGKNLIFGEEGNDNITLWYGEDHIYYDYSYNLMEKIDGGFDTINANNDTTNNQDTLYIKESLSDIDFSLTDKGKSIYIKKSDNNLIKIFNYGLSLNYFKSIDTFIFNGITYSNTDIKDLFTKINKAEEDGTFYDTIWDDVITGTENKDIIRSLVGADIINSGDGDDVITSNGDYSEINSGNGDDIITTTGSYSKINSESGNDRITINGNNSTIKAGDGNDIITSYTTSNIHVEVDAEDGDDTINYSSNGIFNGGNGNDVIKVYTVSGAYSHNQTININGGKGDDTITILSTHKNTVTYNKGDGKDTLNILGITATTYQSKLILNYISMNNDIFDLYDQGASLKLKFDEDNFIDLKSYVNKYSYKYIKEFVFNNIIYTEEDIKNIFTNINKAEVKSGIFYDTVFDDIITGTSSNDIIESRYGADTINSNAGEDKITTRGDLSVIKAGLDNDTIISYGVGSIIEGQEGNDKISYARSGTYDGGNGDDIIQQISVNSSGAVDTSLITNIIGGKGNDKIYAQYGNNNIIYSKDDGEDTVFIYSDSYNRTSTLIINDYSLDKEFFILERSGLDLRLRFDENNSILLSSYISISNIKYLDKFIFNNVEYTNDEIKEIFTKINKAEESTGIYYDTVFDDVITGSENNDIIESRYGKDLINSGNGLDLITTRGDMSTINAGDGNDTIYSYGINSIINGDDGDDKINYGRSGTYNGGDGDDTFTQINYLTNGAVDTNIITNITGGKGNDKIYLRYGQNNIFYNVDDGVDTIYTSTNGSNKVSILTINGYSLNNNIFYLESSGRDLRLKFDENNSILISNYINIANIESIDKFIFNNHEYSKDEIKEIFTKIDKAEDATGIYYDTVFDDIINGSDISDIIESRSGVDIINSWKGNDTITTRGDRSTINSGDGSDIIYSYGINSIINADDGDDKIKYARSGTYNGGEGDDTFEQINYLPNGAVDTNIITNITGGKGNDKIYLIYGSNNINYNLNDGKDIISMSYTGSDNFSKISNLMINGYSFKNEYLNIDDNGSSLKIKFDYENSIILSNFINKTYMNAIDKIYFNGVEYTNQQLIDLATQNITGTENDDILYDTLFNDIFNLIGGKDKIYINKSTQNVINTNISSSNIEVNTTDNIFNFGNGVNEILLKQAKNTLNLDGGELYINHSLTSSSYITTINTGINFNQAQIVNQSNGYITFKFGNSYLNIRSLTYNNLVFNDLNTQNILDFYDKLIGDENNNTLRALDNRNVTINGNGGNDNIIGGSGNDILYGGSGDDTLTGGAGADWLYGGTGNDTLNGGTNEADVLMGEDGNDTYNARFGNNVIDYYGSNTLNIAENMFGKSYKLVGTSNGFAFISSVGTINYTGNASRVEVSSTNQYGINTRYSLINGEINRLIELQAMLDVEEDSNISTQIRNDMSNLWKYE